MRRVPGPLGPRLAALSIVADDGSGSLCDGRDLAERIGFAAIGLNLDLDLHQLDVELRRALAAGISRSDLRRPLGPHAKSLVERDADLSRLAARILPTCVVEETLDRRIDREGAPGLHAARSRALRPAAGAWRRHRTDRPRAARPRPRPAAAELDPTTVAVDRGVERAGSGCVFREVRGRRGADVVATPGQRGSGPSATLRPADETAPSSRSSRRTAVDGRR